ncbi:phage major capsid protein, P2 family [Rappaport israeli]|uniref:phage major capsid protein, P2 family n=1 Tax=Rappaport israeli TaxID=1839807 RepID=UPI000930AC93|nr:phage major capsid protein, P2 family [Rappaport israeli]
MHKLTRQKYNQFLNRIAELNGVDDATTKFSVAPQPEQILVEKIQDSHPFLRSVNSYVVDNQEGEKIHIGVNSTLAGRTDTSDGETERKPRNIASLSNDKYRANQTNFDTFVRYATLDAWRHKKDFQRLLRLVTSKQIGRDRMMIGFNGTSVAANTDRSANPLLQDVNKGWLQHLRESKSSAVMNGAKIGSINGKDYTHVDAAVFDAVNTLIEPWHRDSELVVICGRKILSSKYFHLIDSNDVPSERKALESLMVNKSLGGHKTYAIPFFPEDAIFITPLSNLSIYTQSGTTRLAYYDNPKLDRIEEYRSVNEAYVIEDYDACCLLEGIKTPNDDGSAWV